MWGIPRQEKEPLLDNSNYPSSPASDSERFFRTGFIKKAGKKIPDRALRCQMARRIFSDKKLSDCPSSYFRIDYTVLNQYSELFRPESNLPDLG